MGVYDRWLTLECLKCHKQTHRTSKNAITAALQPIKWWPVYFASDRKYYKGLERITKKEWDSVDWLI